ncbi:MAG: hypothetical protein ACK4JD_04620 [Thermoflexales bacterium]
MTYPDFPLVMAIQNYMPVALSALGLIWIAQMIRATHAAAGRLAFVGVALVVLAGILKASWKLVMSVARVDAPLLSQSLFPLIAPGFTFVAWALFLSRQMRGRNGSDAVVWLPPALVSASALLFALALAVTRPDRTWVFVLIGVATVANVALATLLIHSALRRRSAPAAALFALNLVVTFALSGIAGMPNKSLEVHWIEQIISTISNAGFAWAAWMLIHPKSVALQPGLT